MNKLMAMIALAGLTTNAHASLNHRSSTTAMSVKEFLKECMKAHPEGWCIQHLANDLLPSQPEPRKQTAELQSTEDSTAAR